MFPDDPPDVHHWGKVEVQYYGQDEEAESAREVILSETGPEEESWKILTTSNSPVIASWCMGRQW